MIAEPSGGASGQASDIAIHAREILRIREVLTNLYQKHCTLPEETVEAAVSRFSTCSHNREARRLNTRIIEAALERDYFMTGTSHVVPPTLLIGNVVYHQRKRALKFGIVDTILEKRPPSNVVEGLAS